MNAINLQEARHLADGLGRPQALVIGSGFGGLAAAIRLQLRGWQVTVLEKLDAPGGRAYVHRVDGHTFDAGPTIITVPALLEELWQLAGRRLSDDITLKHLDPFYRIRFDDGDHFDYSGDIDRMRAEVRRINPADAAGFERFMHEADDCHQRGFEVLGTKPFNTVGDLLQAIPSIARMRGWRSLHQMVAGHLKHPKLRMAMSLQSLLIGGNPYSVTCVYSLVNALERQFGVHWTMGGTGSLITAMTGLLRSLGGQLRCQAEVRRIDVEGGRVSGVTLQGGQSLRADIVVSNADAAWTYLHLIDPQWRRSWPDRRVERGRYSMSLFVWYFGTDRRYDNVPHHMMVLGPRYRELLDDIFRKHRLCERF